jgi:quinoprotein glucose dehydrogenase
MLAAVLPMLPALSAAANPSPNSNQDWPVYGGGLDAQHYSARSQINKDNVRDLQVTWTFHTRALQVSGYTNNRSSFEANPVLWNGVLYFDTPYDQVFAVNAASGKEKWTFDPNVSHNTPFVIVASRGVALWHGSTRSQDACGQDRVFVASLDHRLTALDAGTGAACLGFGRQGTVDLADDQRLQATQWYEVTSPPTVVGDVVVVGSSVADNQMVEAASGVIRGFDARSGELLWRFEPLPWAETAKLRSGSGGTWSVIAADAALGLLYAPTGSPSVDFYGANRPGDDRDANSVVALDARTGRRIWGFQVVHHDLWDLDIAAEPLLFTFRHSIPAVAVTTKMGMTFVLDRRTGRPLYPVSERPVPKSTIPGEQTAPTQPFSSLPLMAPMSIDPAKVRARNDAETDFCRQKLAALVDRGIYTPVGLTPTLLYPGSLGGVNWGSAALNPTTAILYANVNSLPYETRLVPRVQERPSLSSLPQETWDYWRNFFHANQPADTTTVPRETAPLFMPADSGGFELSAQLGTPYRIYRAPLVDRTGLPCAPRPWGALVALDLDTGMKLWTTPLGTLVPGESTGAVTVGGPIVTAGGLVFSGGGGEPTLYAFDASSGRELWRGPLPFPAQSTPMTYQIGGRQYVVIAAGGHGMLTRQIGDTLVAFALPSAPNPSPARSIEHVERARRSSNQRGQ